MRAASSSKHSWVIAGTAAWNGFEASRAWKKVSGFSAVPRRFGASGVMPRLRKARMSSSRTSARRSSSVSSSMVLTSWLVRKPSKKWRKGTRLRRVAAWATSAKSCASWTLEELSIAKPVMRTLMTSEWSPKMDSEWVATVRAATWMTAGVSSPAILNMFGTIRSRPWEAVNVVPRTPLLTIPCNAPAAPPSDCISMTSGTAPQMFARPWLVQVSESSPIGEDGVIG